MTWKLLATPEFDHARRLSSGCLALRLHVVMAAVIHQAEGVLKIAIACIRQLSRVNPKKIGATTRHVQSPNPERRSATGALRSSNNLLGSNGEFEVSKLLQRCT